MLLEKLKARNASTDNNYSRYQLHPQAYAREVLKLQLTPDQELMLQSLVDHRRTIVQASHAIGKTFVAGVASNWWYDCWSDHIAYITAPTWPQALGLTFKQLKTFRRKQQLPGTILETGLLKDDDKSHEGSHYVRALNAERGEGFQGEHAAPILIVIEEGVGVPKYIWDAAGGLMTHPDCRILAIGNPTDEATEFGLATESPLFHVLSISCLNHPNITAELQCQPAPFPDAVRLLWLYEMLDKECEQVDTLTEDAFTFVALEQIKGALEGRPADLTQTCYYMPTAYFQGRVLGEFPTQADQQVIPKAWLRSCPVQELTDDAPELGVDVARFGDDRTTIVGRVGPCAVSAKELRKMDTVEVKVAIKDAAREIAGNHDPKRIKIKIDVTGGLGAGPHDELLAEGYNVVAVNSSAKANDQEQYKNKRSELWFDVRNRARNKQLDLSRLRKDVRERLIRELSSPKYKAAGQKEVEKKADMKKRLDYSPDLADGFNLAFAPDSRNEVFVVRRR